LRAAIRKVHWLQALATAMSIVSFGPSSSRAAKSTAYDTDIVEVPLRERQVDLEGGGQRRRHQQDGEQDRVLRSSPAARTRQAGRRRSR
jgi:hypothetical protein